MRPAFSAPPRVPRVLMADTPEPRIGKAADGLLPGKRGRADRVALHGGTLVTMEALVLGLAAADASGAVSTLEHLNDLREAVSGQRHEVA